MKIRAHRGRCQGHGLCFVVEQDLFPLDDAGQIAIHEDYEVPSGREQYARQGVRACPEQALEIIEET